MQFRKSLRQATPEERSKNARLWHSPPGVIDLRDKLEPLRDEQLFTAQSMAKLEFGER